jgi:hypothetical protein
MPNYSPVQFMKRTHVQHNGFRSYVTSQFLHFHRAGEMKSGTIQRTYSPHDMFGMYIIIRVQSDRDSFQRYRWNVGCNTYFVFARTQQKVQISFSCSFWNSRALGRVLLAPINLLLTILLNDKCRTTDVFGHVAWLWVDQPVVMRFLLVLNNNGKGELSMLRIEPLIPTCIWSLRSLDPPRRYYYGHASTVSSSQMKIFALRWWTMWLLLFSSNWVCCVNSMLNIQASDL